MTDDASDPKGSDTQDGQQVPLADLVERVGERRDRMAEVEEDLFADPGFETLPGDTVWEAIDDAANSGSVMSSDDRGGGSRAHVVSKRDFCEGCTYFDDPPFPRCTHDGTEIEEFVDREHVRVLDCPIVEERREAAADRPD